MPTVKWGNQTEQNSIRYKNLVSRADQLLEQEGLSPDHRASFIDPLRAYEGNHDFWEHQEHGLAMFIVPDERAELYRLPVSFEERSYLSTRPYIKPLMRLFADSAHYYVLDISLEGPRLFEGDQFGMQEIAVEDAPKNYEEVLQYDDPEKQLHSHTRMSPREGSQQAYFHGHGQGKDEKQTRIRRYFEALSAAVDKKLSGGEHIPIYLAGEEYLHSLYAEASSLDDVKTEGGFPRDPRRMSAEELYEEMWPTIEDHFLADLRSAVEQFKINRESFQVSTDLADILTRTPKAQVGTLVVPEDKEVWGVFDENSGRIESDGAQGEELVDRAVRETLLTGGTAFVSSREQIGADTELFALLRYEG
jgi:hypothetical protein